MTIIWSHKSAEISQKRKRLRSSHNGSIIWGKSLNSQYHQCDTMLITNWLELECHGQYALFQSSTTFSTLGRSHILSRHSGHVKTFAL